MGKIGGKCHSSWNTGYSEGNQGQEGMTNQASPSVELLTESSSPHSISKYLLHCESAQAGMLMVA